MTVASPTVHRFTRRIALLLVSCLLVDSAQAVPFTLLTARPARVSVARVMTEQALVARSSAGFTSSDNPPAGTVRAQGGRALFGYMRASRWTAGLLTVGFLTSAFSLEAAPAKTRFQPTPKQETKIEFVKSEKTSVKQKVRKRVRRTVKKRTRIVINVQEAVQQQKQLRPALPRASKSRVKTAVRYSMSRFLKTFRVTKASAKRVAPRVRYQIDHTYQAAMATIGRASVSNLTRNASIPVAPQARATAVSATAPQAAAPQIAAPSASLSRRRVPQDKASQSAMESVLTAQSQQLARTGRIPPPPPPPVRVENIRPIPPPPPSTTKRRTERAETPIKRLPEITPDIPDFQVSYAGMAKDADVLVVEAPLDQFPSDQLATMLRDLKAAGFTTLAYEPADYDAKPWLGSFAERDNDYRANRKARPLGVVEERNTILVTAFQTAAVHGIRVVGRRERTNPYKTQQAMDREFFDSVRAHQPGKIVYFVNPGQFSTRVKHLEVARVGVRTVRFFEPQIDRLDIPRSVHFVLPHLQEAVDAFQIYHGGSWWLVSDPKGARENIDFMAMARSVLAENSIDPASVRFQVAWIPSNQEVVARVIGNASGKGLTLLADPTATAEYKNSPAGNLLARLRIEHEAVHMQTFDEDRRIAKAVQADLLPGRATAGNYDEVYRDAIHEALKMVVEYRTDEATLRRQTLQGAFDPRIQETHDLKAYHLHRYKVAVARMTGSEQLAFEERVRFYYGSLPWEPRTQLTQATPAPVDLGAATVATPVVTPELENEKERDPILKQSILGLLPWRTAIWIQLQFNLLAYFLFAPYFRRLRETARRRSQAFLQAV